MRRLGVFALLLGLFVGIVGCGTTGGVTNGPDQDLVKYKSDVQFFAKIATSAALDQTDLTDEKLMVIRDYVDAVRKLIAVPGQPDWTGARKLAAEKLPEGTRFIGLTMIDVLERYSTQYVQNLGGKAEAYQVLVAAGLDGAVQAINEYTGHLEGKITPGSPTTRPAKTRIACKTGMCPYTVPRQ